MSTSVSNLASGAVPEHVALIAGVMATYRAPWALCGGWAVDAWLGRHTREHGDVDIIVFEDDQRVLFEHLRGWQLIGHDAPEPGGGGNADLWTGRTLRVPGHLHGRIDHGEPPPTDGVCTLDEGWVADIQINERQGERWTLMRDPLVAVPLANAVRPCPWGIPAVVPEVLLFYKALDLRRRDKADFAALMPALTADQRAWLREAIDRVGHPWMRALDTATVSA